MDSSSRSNGSRRPPGPESGTRPPTRSRVAARLERAVVGALGGDREIVVSATGPELLGDAVPVAEMLNGFLAAPEIGLESRWRVQEMLRRSRLYDEILNALQSPNSLNRAAAARIAGAARLTGAIIWLGDLVKDPSPGVRDAAVRGLAEFGGRRAVDTLVASADAIPLHRLAIALAQAASDVDIEAQMRQPVSEHAAVATVLACGLKRDSLRIPPLLGIAHDRRWPMRVRLAACKALAMIGSRSAADGLARLAEDDPDEELRAVAQRAHRRLLRRAVAKRR